MNIGALIIRIGFRGQYTIFIMRNPQSSIGNYFGSYITVQGFQGLGTRAFEVQPLVGQRRAQPPRFHIGVAVERILRDLFGCSWSP